jgi:hypothetical protein
MRGVVVTKSRVDKEKKINLILFLQKNLIKPFTFGLIGYFGFLTLLIISKYLGFIIGNSTSFQIDSIDFLISAMGFAFIFITKLKESTRDNNS